MEESAGVTSARLKLFVSYSRRDLEVADQLVAALEAFGYAVIIDRKGIHGAEKWEQRLGQMILEADTIVFVLTPASAHSEVCRWEVDQAIERKKRIVPVLGKPLDGAQPHDALRDLNYIHFYPEPTVPGSGWGAGLARLQSTLSIDIDWVREHTRLAELAARWNGTGRTSDLLVRGSELVNLKAWRDGRPPNAPDLTVEQRLFLQASEDAEVERDGVERRRLDEIRAAQEERERALRDAEAAQKAQAAILEKIQAEQARRSHFQSRNRYLTGLAAVFAIALFAGTAWNLRQTQRRETVLLASAVERAIATEDYERALRIAIHGAPKPGRIPWLTLDWHDDEAKLIERGLLNAANYSTVRTIIAPESPVVHAALSPDKKAIVTISKDGVARLWDIATHRMLRSFEHPEKSTVLGDLPLDVAFDSDGARILTVYAHGARIWRVSDGAVLKDITPNARIIAGRAFNADWSKVAIWALEPMPANVDIDGSASLSVKPKGLICIHDLSSGGCTAEFKVPWDSIAHVTISPDGGRIAAAFHDGLIRVWDIHTGTTIADIPGNLALTFNADGTRLITADTYSRDAEIWDLISGQPQGKLRGHTEAVTSAAFSSDGTNIVTASEDKSIRTWDGMIFQPFEKFTGHESDVSRATFIRDHSSILSVAEDVRIWEVNSARMDWDGGPVWLSGRFHDIAGPELLQRACAERLPVGSRAFTMEDARDAILAGLESHEPCDDTGPLKLEWWVKAVRSWRKSTTTQE